MWGPDDKSDNGSPFDAFNRFASAPDAPWNDPAKANDPWAAWNQPNGLGTRGDEIKEYVDNLPNGGGLGWSFNDPAGGGGSSGGDPRGPGDFFGRGPESGGGFGGGGGEQPAGSSGPGDFFGRGPDSGGSGGSGPSDGGKPFGGL